MPPTPPCPSGVKQFWNLCCLQRISFYSKVSDSLLCLNVSVLEYIPFRRFTSPPGQMKHQRNVHPAAKKNKNGSSIVYRIVFIFPFLFKRESWKSSRGPKQMSASAIRKESLRSGYLGDKIPRNSHRNNSRYAKHQIQLLQLFHGHLLTQCQFQQSGLKATILSGGGPPNFFYMYIYISKKKKSQ